jgi:membrane protein DedA with SNARE-associated domain
MKTLRVTLLTLAVAAATSAALAGPGIGYWNARRADREAAKSAPAPKVETDKCERMVVKQGKRTTTVECTGATAETAQCKAACGM